MSQLAQTKPEPGRADYEADCARIPTYHDGTRRRTWAQLGQLERYSWGRYEISQLDPS